MGYTQPWCSAFRELADTFRFLPTPLSSATSRSGRSHEPLAEIQAALAAGGVSTQEMTTQFYGDRSGGVRDPSGVTWWISTHVEDVSREELERRMAAMGQ